MKEQRLSERFSIRLPLKLEAITSSRTKVFDVITKNISATGAFIYTKEASYIPNDTRFIINSNYPNKSSVKLDKLMRLKKLTNFTGTMVRSTSEGIAIHFNRPVELFV